MSKHQGHTPGPLKVVQPENNHSKVQIVDADGNVVFEEYRPCHSSSDRSVRDALECRNFPFAEQAACAAANERHLADMHLRADAPMLLRQRDELADMLLQYVETIARAGGGDRLAFVQEIRRADDKARALLASIKEESR